MLRSDPYASFCWSGSEDNNHAHLFAKEAGQLTYIPSVSEISSLPGLLARQWWSAERLREWQEQRLRELVLHAYTNVPFYRDRWSAVGVHPDEIRSLDDLTKLPIIPSREFRSAPYQETIASNIQEQDCVLNKSSGTSGRPMTVRYTREDHFRVIKAMSVRHYRAHGVGVREKLLRFTPHPGRDRTSWYERVGFWRRLNLFTNAEPESWLEPLRAFQPDVIAGSPMTFPPLIWEMRKSGLSLRPRVVFSSGARLEPHDRNLMEEEFATPVVDVYGAWEGGFIAWQCRDCGAYHVNSDSVIMEVWNDGKSAAPGETGEVVITNLFSRAMPFVRYGLGDVAAFSRKSPSCGRSLPLIDAVWGRNDDCVELPSGEKVGVYPIYMGIWGYEVVLEWRLIQSEDGDCTLLVVPRDKELMQKQAPEIEDSMRRTLKGEVEVRLVLVDRIEREPGKKWKTVVSKKIEKQREAQP